MYRVGKDDLTIIARGETLSVSYEELVCAFSIWQRQYLARPEEFQSAEETTGEGTADFFMKLLKDQKGNASDQFYAMVKAEDIMVYRIITRDGSTYYARVDDGDLYQKVRDPDEIAYYDIVQMSEETYLSIPATIESHAFFSPPGQSGIEKVNEFIEAQKGATE